jgi:hypothetical protein
VAALRSLTCYAGRERRHLSLGGLGIVSWMSHIRNHDQTCVTELLPRAAAMICILGSSARNIAKFCYINAITVGASRATMKKKEEKKRSSAEFSLVFLFWSPGTHDLSRKKIPIRPQSLMLQKQFKTDILL